MFTGLFGLITNFFGSSSKIWIIISILAILISVFFYIQSLISDNRLQREQKERLETVLQAQEMQLESIRNDLNRMTNIQELLRNRLNQASSESRELIDRISNRNFEELSRRYPERIETMINRGTRDALRCNELITGSPLTPEEKNGIIVNTICPELLK